MKTAVDWSKARFPWNMIGPEFACELQEGPRKKTAANWTAAKGAALRSRRRELGLSQSALGKFAGTSKSNLAYWEAGDATPSPEQRAMLCEALGIEI